MRKIIHCVRAATSLYFYSERRTEDDDRWQLPAVADNAGKHLLI